MLRWIFCDSDGKNQKTLVKCQKVFSEENVKRRKHLPSLRHVPGGWRKKQKGRYFIVLCFSLEAGAVNCITEWCWSICITIATKTERLHVFLLPSFTAFTTWRYNRLILVVSTIELSFISLLLKIFQFNWCYLSMRQFFIALEALFSILN